jgi:hypothetical protein
MPSASSNTALINSVDFVQTRRYKIFRSSNHYTTCVAKWLYLSRSIGKYFLSDCSYPKHFRPSAEYETFRSTIYKGTVSFCVYIDWANSRSQLVCCWSWHPYRMGRSSCWMSFNIWSDWFDCEELHVKWHSISDRKVCIPCVEVWRPLCFISDWVAIFHVGNPSSSHPCWMAPILLLNPLRYMLARYEFSFVVRFRSNIGWVCWHTLDAYY